MCPAAQTTSEGRPENREEPGPAEIAGLIATLALITCLVANAILNIFYHFGVESDAEQFSVLVWHNGWRLMLTPASGAETFFNQHISWFYWLPSGISWLLPFGRIPFFAGIMGLLHAVLGLGFWLLLNELWPSRRPVAVLLKYAAAVCFALNGHSQELMQQAIMETAGPAFALVFLWGLFKRDHRAALAAFVLALAQREDMGFHIFGLLALVLLLDLARRVPRAEWKPVMVYASAALLYSLAVLLLKRLFFKDWGIFSLHYSGAGPYRHLTQALMAARFENLLLHRHWIWGPGLIALLWAAASRNPYIALGWLAFAPWLALNLTAVLEVIGNLDIHYGYPFMIAGAWPLLAASRVFAEPRGLKAAPPAAAVAWALALLLSQQPASLSPELRWLSPRISFVREDEVARSAVYDAFERRLPQMRILEFRADKAVFGIAPYALDIKLNNIPTMTWNAARGNYDLGAAIETGVDAVFYFTGTGDSPRIGDLIRANHLDRHYRLPGTKIYLSSAADLSGAPALEGLFVPADPPPEVWETQGGGGMPPPPPRNALPPQEEGLPSGGLPFRSPPLRSPLGPSPHG